MTLRHPINYLKFAACTCPQSISSRQEKATLITATTLSQSVTRSKHIRVSCQVCTLRETNVCLRVWKQGAKCCSARSFAWFSSWKRGSQRSAAKKRGAGKQARG